MEKKDRDAAIDLIKANSRSRLISNIYLMYWDIETWTSKKWTEDGWSDIKVDHLKLIYLVAGADGLSNNELAKQAGVTKQATSQMVALLEKRGVLIVKPNPDDSRAKLISLSDYGIEFLNYFSSSTNNLMKQYTDIIGEEKMKTVTGIIRELADGIAAGWQGPKPQK